MKNLCAAFIISLVLTCRLSAGTATTFSTPGTWTWVCPAGVTAVRLECWGGGGAGGSASRTASTGQAQYSGGGAGGAYAKYTSYPVIPGNTYYVTVGAGGVNTSTNDGTTVAGGDSWFNSVSEPSTDIIARGGAGGESQIGILLEYGAGGIGTAEGSAGDIVTRGGNGATGAKSAAGGGGSSAGPTSNGSSATSNIGASAPAGGGAGGTGSTSSSKDGSPGAAPGGGGSGARDTSTTVIYLRAGGAGGSGKVVLTDITSDPYPYAQASVPTGNGSGAENNGGGLTVYKKEPLTLSEIPAAGFAPFLYAWRKVGSETVLGTNSTLLISSPVNGDQYTCAVASARDGVFATSAPATIKVSAYYNPKKVVIIKADDFAVPTTPSHDPGPFIQASRELGIKVGLGIVVNSISGNENCYAWIREQEAFGDVEVWNHGWDHAQWTEDGHTISEFEGSGVDHMRQHLAWSQADLKEATGRDVCAFGTPYNGFDADCATVMNEHPELRLFFSHTVSDGGGGLDSRFRMVNINSEGGGVGHPTLEYAMQRLPPGADGPASFQVHPYYFGPADLEEYKKIVQYILDNGYSIILPSEYVPLPIVLSAGFNATPTRGDAPLTVTFTDTSTGVITNRFWDFGDGTTTNTMDTSLSHTYQSPGTNTVTLIVSDADGSSTNTQSNLIIAFSAPVKPLAVKKFTASGTWVCPDGVTSVNVECWGGGGAGGSASRTPGSGSVQYGGGGAGGAYAKYFSYPVTPGNTYYINVGEGGFNNSASNGTAVAGGDTWFNSVNEPSTGILAKGGPGGISAIGNTIGSRYGAGGRGTTTGSAGDVIFAGGRGASGSASGAGGGGSSAGPDNTGINAALNAGGTAPAGGGDGGTGPATTAANGGNGFVPGGGGSGARDSSMAGSEVVRNGGRGGSGQIVLSYEDTGELSASFSAVPTHGLAPLDVTFTDTSTGEITNRFWSFGDGSTTNTTAASLSHIYQSPGTNTVTLIVSGPDGSSANIQSNLIIASSTYIELFAGFSASPTSGNAPLTVTFTDVSTGVITNRFWNFGDGITTNTTATNLSHIYESPGIRTVTLIVSDAYGSSTNIQSNLIVANSTNVELSASFSALPTSGNAPLPVTFTDTSTGVITNRFWNFGDGSTTNTTAASLSHIYQSPGTNTVILIVSSADGSSTNTRSNYIIAAEPPQAGETNVTAFTSSGTWICPEGITSVKVECWGGGGAGGSAARTLGSGSSQYGGGGAGGAYARYNAYPVTPGNTYYVNVGAGGVNTSSVNDTVAAGGDSWFNSVNQPSAVILAKGGAGGQSAIGNTSATAYGTGGTGTSAGSLGNVVYAGGNGGTQTASANGYGGSGGGSGGTGSAGNNGNASGTGAAAVTGGGNGGNPNPTMSSSGAGQTPTTPPGGGGGGARDASVSPLLLRNGGAGAPGQVTLSYVVVASPLTAGFSASPTSGGAPLTVTFTDTSTGDIVSRYWDFGDGTVTNTVAASLSHVYPVPGTSTVVLIVSDSAASSTNTQSNLIVATSVDTVGDGVADWWRFRYFGGNGKTTNADSEASADFDHDGRSNYAEYIADTDPSSASSRLAVTGLSISGGQIRVSWTGGSNSCQTIECRAGLTDTNGWYTVYSNIPPTSISNEWSQSDTNNAGKRFYRIRAWR